MRKLLGNLLRSLFSAMLLVSPALAQQSSTRTGSAFVVDPKGFLLTCAHLIEEAAKVEIILGEKTYTPKVIAQDRQTDLALLSIGVATPSSLPLADDERVKSVKPEQPLCVVGFPPGASRPEGLITAGAAVAGMTVRDQVPGLQFQTEPGIGDGGLLLNLQGEVVGMVNSRFQGGGAGGKADFAVSIAVAKPLLRKHDVEWPAVGTREPLEMASLMRRVAPSVALLIATLPEQEKEEEQEEAKPAEPEEQAPPNCMWVSTEEMIEVTNSISLSPESLRTLEAKSLREALSQMLGAVYFLQGLDLEEMKLTEEALVYLTKAEKLRPNSALTAASVARVAQALGETKLATEALQRAQALDENVTLPRKRKGSKMWIPRDELEFLRQKLAATEGKGASENVDVLRSALARGAALFAVWKGDYRWQRGVLAMAESEYAQALALDPECPEALVANAYVADKKGELEEAQQLLRKAYELNARSPRVRAAASEFVAVYRKDFLPPKVEILSPKEGEEIKPAKDTVIEFTVKDDLGKVQGVEVFADNTSIAKLFGAGKHRVEWNTRGLQYTEPTIRVVAEDAAGNRTEARVKVRITR